MAQKGRFTNDDDDDSDCVGSLTYSIFTELERKNSYVSVHS
jgi:hypothetical protein